MMSIDKSGALAAVLGAAVDAVVVINQKGIIQQVSDSVARLFEYRPEECIGKNISLFMPEPDRTAHDGYIANYLAGGSAKVIGVGRKTTGRKKSGATFPMHLSVGQFRFNGGDYFLGICHDLTEYTEAITQLRDAEKRYKDIVESQKHYICRLDRSLRVTFANASLVKALGVGHHEVLGASWAAIISEGNGDLSGALGPLLAEGGVDEITVKVSMKSKGAATVVEWSFRRTSESNAADEVQGFGIDISEKEAAILQAEYLKDHDQLTGLINARSLVSQLAEAAKTGKIYAVLNLDISRFGQINQRYGYAVGDSVLVEIAGRIKQLLPSEAWIARTGGDKFIVACQVRDHGDAALLASGLIDALAESYQFEGSFHVLGCKVGVALFPLDHQEVARLPDLAEAALREAKINKESVVFFSEQSHERHLRQIMVEQGLKEAMRDGSIEAYLQPKVSLATFTTHSYEALARWNHEELGQVSPGEFIPLAEASGLGPDLDHYIIRRVAKLVANISAAGTPCLPVAINITANHFSDEALFAHISQALDDYSLAPGAIELEITEGAIINLSQTVSENLRRLRRLGMRVSIDDFGTGYSSLSYLKNLDVDELKIDKSFIDDIESAKGQRLVQAVIGLAQAFGLTVTAEGVETKAQVDLLVEMGCDLVQGYYFSPALPPEEAVKHQLENWV